jgi:very-short-patch-repair endonuclease
MFDRPFRGSDAVAAGLVTPGELRGPRFRRLLTGIYVLASVEVDLRLRSLAAAVAVRGRGVLSGVSAAELLGASCGAKAAPAEVIVPGRGMRSTPLLLVSTLLLATDEVTAVKGVPVTTPLVTALHLACRTPIVEAIVAVDALTFRHGFAPEAVLRMGSRHLGARGSGHLREVVRRANRLAESPMETRIRVAIEDAGLVVPVLQHQVGPYRLDMAYPGIKLAIEYDGREHLTQERALKDLRREAYLVARGWRIIRFRAVEVMHRPNLVSGTVCGELIRAARERGLPMAGFDPR